MLDDTVSIVGLLCVGFFVAIYAGSAAWAVGDAQKRGHSGGLVVLLFWLLGPLSAVVWLVIRPRERLVERQPTDYRDAEHAMDAATRLEGFGDWDEAVAVLTYTVEEWPKHGEYARQCIKAIDAKRSLA